jgi:hypothetical protein
VTLNFKGFQNINRQTYDAGSQGPNVGPPLLHKSDATGGDFQTTAAIGSSHLVTGGVEAIQDRVESSSLGVHQATRGALYLQDEIEVGKASACATIPTRLIKTNGTQGPPS